MLQLTLRFLQLACHNMDIENWMCYSIPELKGVWI